MARTKAPDPCEGCPLTPEQVAACEDAMRQLVTPGQTLAWCERCKIPCEAVRREYDDLVGFFQRVLENSRGQQSPITGAP